MDNNHKEIAEVLQGYTKEDFEEIFEEIIVPLYTTSCSGPKTPTDYIVVKRKASQKEKFEEVFKSNTHREIMGAIDNLKRYLLKKTDKIKPFNL